MKTVGKQLQDARTAKGWSPELAARETKIRVDRLNELEADDYSNFSSPTYARGFVRTYARSLGLDEYKILRQLDNKLPEDDNASFINDTGVPYMPEPSKVSKPFEVGRGVYIAAGIGTAVLLLIAFVLVQTYRAGYFAQALPATMPNSGTNSVAAVPDDTAQRAMPADSNAAPVPLPVDAATLAANPPPADTNVAPTTAAAPANAAAPVDTNAAPRALPVDLNALAASSSAVPTAPVAPAVPAAAPEVAVTPLPSTNTDPSAEAISAATIPTQATPTPSPAIANATDAASAPTTPLNTTTPPRAQAVDLNALSAAPTAPAPTPRPHASPSLSARQANARPVTPVAPTPDASRTPVAPVVTPVAAPVVANVPAAASSAPAQEFSAAPELAANQGATQQPPVDAAPTPSPIASENETAPAADSASALTGGDSASTGVPPAKNSAEKSRGKRLVLTASHDSFVRVIALDGAGNKVRYSSILHSGDSISFSDRKYTINVGTPTAVDIALDGINYGPHSDHSEPDTFTVESHQP